jgi:hypothetical protein
MAENHKEFSTLEEIVPFQFQPFTIEMCKTRRSYMKEITTTFAAVILIGGLQHIFDDF